MTLPPLADLAAMAARLGITLDPESAAGARASATLDDASALIRSIAGMTWVDEEDSGDGLLPLPDIIESIALACAMRAYRNPSGAAQASVGDVSVSYGQATSGVQVYLTRDEKRSIFRAIGKISAGSIGLESDMIPGATDQLFVPVEGGGDLLPLGPIPWEED